MKRRDVLKGISGAAGSVICGVSPLRAMAAEEPEVAKPAPLAEAIRGLVRNSAEPMQPIRITLTATEAAVAVTTVDGHEIDRRQVDAGVRTYDLLVPAVTSSRDAQVAVTLGAKTASATIKLEPVRKVLIYVLPHSHHDLGYTDLQADVEEKQMKNITLGMDLAEKTSSYPEGSRFVWNLEVLWGADLFLKRRSPAEIARFVDAVKKGWIALNGMYANELTGLCRPEELLQLFRFGIELGQRCERKVDAAMLSDVPGFTWGTITAMAQAGIRYFSAAPNFFDRIGSLMVEWQDKPFWATSPSGKEKVLVWIPWTGYAMSHVMKLGAEWVGAYQHRLDTVAFPYDISCIRWSGHGDNAAPDPELSEFLKGWNETYEWPRFAISSTSEAFAAFEKRHGTELPVKHADLTPYWEDGAASSALETAISRNAADRLVQAEAFDAMYAAAGSKPEGFNEAWRNILLYSEHTWGAWCSVSDSESPFTKKQWAFKRNFAIDADRLSKQLLEEALKSSGGPTNAQAIDVHNSTSWDRTELVLIPATLSAGGDHVATDRGRAVPSQRLKTGDLVIMAQDVPAFGAARFHLSHAPAAAPVHAVTYENGVLSNSLIAVRIDAKTGDVIELRAHGLEANLIDHTEHQAANQYLFLPGSDVTHLANSGDATISVEEAGPLVYTLRIESSAPGCKRLVRTVQLAAGADHVELNNLVDKERAALNPNPGKGGPGEEFAQRGAKESVQFCFPFAVREGVMRIDVPLAVMRPETDQLPGANRNWLPVGRWVDVSNAEHGVTWATLDAPLVEVGGVTANLLGSQRDPKAWRSRIAPTQRFYSWAMNNHWGTNYLAYQEGPVLFRYALRPHAAYDAAAASRFAIGLSQPLVATAASGRPLASPLLKVEPADVLAFSLKRSGDGDATILRFFGASGEDRRVKLTLPRHPRAKLWLSDGTERRGRPVEGSFAISGWDVVTVRVDQNARDFAGDPVEMRDHDLNAHL